MNFMSVISFLDDITTTNGTINCGEDSTLVGILSIAKVVVRIIQILVPIALIIWGSIDIGKAVIAGDEKKIKEAQKPFVKRIVAAIIVFLIPWLVNIVMSLVNGGAYYPCWQNANKGFKGVSNLSDPVNGK